ncbi:MAG: hypothetical protein LBK72_09575 [Bifidobacteriaceae bacterium]|nr:hypothetical protein [Bifidobacteriaceae bacterium]
MDGKVEASSLPFEARVSPAWAVAAYNPAPRWADPISPCRDNDKAVRVRVP